MTEKDREIVESLLEKSIGNQSKIFEEQFKGVSQILHSMNELINEKLTSIDKKVSITNGKVAEQERKIFEYSKEVGSHYVACPNSVEIKDLKNKVTNLQMMEVGRDAVSKFTWKQITGMGIIIGVVFTILNFVIRLI